MTTTDLTLERGSGAYTWGTKNLAVTTGPTEPILTETPLRIRTMPLGTNRIWHAPGVDVYANPVTWTHTQRLLFSRSLGLKPTVGDTSSALAIQ